jgi:hypothetical protein
MRKVLIASAIALSLLAGATPAHAHKQVIDDPNDTPGRLDIKKAVTAHHGTGGDMNIIFRLVTYDRFFKKHLRLARGYIAFLIRRGPESNWLLQINRRPNGRLRATLVMCIEAQGCDFKNTQRYPVARPNQRTVRVVVPRSDLSGIGPVLRWVSETSFGRGCKGNCHFDRAPNNGLARHEL